MQKHHRTAVLLAVLLAAASSPTSAAVGIAASIEPRAVDAWGPLQETGDRTLAIPLDGGTTALISVGGEDDATIYDERRTAPGVAGTKTAITAIGGVEACRPVDAASSLGDFAVGVECQMKTGLEDPPSKLVELVWTADDGWVWQVHRRYSLGSVDSSPQGQYFLFAASSQYGEPHHLTSYHPDLGWRDLTRREADYTYDDLVAAITDSGNVVALRGNGFEDEPGYWYGGRLRIETYSDRTGRWTRQYDARYPDGGIEPTAIDMAAGRIVATVVRSRSTGKLRGLANKVIVLAGRPDRPRLWSPPGWSRDVLAASAGVTQDGAGVAAFQYVVSGGTAKSWLATWSPTRGRPRVNPLGGRTTVTYPALFGSALDLSVNANGHAALAQSNHRRGDDLATVEAASFNVQPRGRVSDWVDASWQQPRSTTVTAIASETSSSVTLGTVTGFQYYAPATRWSTGP